MRTKFIRLVKSIFFSTPLYKYFLPRMKFDMTLRQLSIIFNAIEEAGNKGAVVEVGVGGGSTSILMNYYIKQNNILGKYAAIDTFSGFTDEDIHVENSQRGKESQFNFYQSNSIDWFGKTLSAHGFNDANIIQADCKEMDFARVGPIGVCLFDVDLYNPTKVALPKIFEHLVEGGIILVDDCDPLHPIYDGASQAYLEFCQEMNIRPEIVEKKIGIIRKT